MIKLLLSLFLLLTACTPGTRYTLHEDNDYFKPTKNNDRDFSQGVRITADKGRHSYFVGQNFYTPPNKSFTELQTEERPYAGFLYVGGAVRTRPTSNTQNVYEGTLGIIGPHSYAEQAQNTVHRWIGDNPARGWEHQLHDELGIILKGEKQYLTFQKSNLDLVSSIGAHLGNVFTQGYTGAQLRYGHNLPDAFSQPEIVFPRLPKIYDPWSYYINGGPWVRAVAQNIFLDGNTFRDSHSVDKEYFVTEGRLGFVVAYEGYRFSYTYVIQTKEYTTQESGSDFGEINLSFTY